MTWWLGGATSQVAGSFNFCQPCSPANCRCHRWMIMFFFLCVFFSLAIGKLESSVDVLLDTTRTHRSIPTKSMSFHTYKQVWILYERCMCGGPDSCNFGHGVSFFCSASLDETKSFCCFGISLNKRATVSERWTYFGK